MIRLQTTVGGRNKAVDYVGATRVEFESRKSEDRLWLHVIGPDGIMASWQQFAVVGYEILPENAPSES